MARRYVKKGRVGHLHFVHLIYTPPPHKPGRQEVAADVTCMCLGKDAQLADLTAELENESAKCEELS